MDIDAQTLCACLQALPPVELLGMSLMQAHPPLAAQAPARESLQAAVIELVAYTQHCTATADRLHALTPQPLLTLHLLEFGL